MRLTDAEVAAIKVCTREAFGADAVVRLFGGRIDDSRRGGDIDLHVEVTNPEQAIEAPARFRRLLENRIGERAYDILVGVAGNGGSPVHAKALREGIVL